jgi:hypothetical protein
MFDLVLMFGQKSDFNDYIFFQLLQNSEGGELFELRRKEIRSIGVLSLA